MKDTEENSPLCLTLDEFCGLYSKESWKGTDTAFRNGAKSAVTGSECNYFAAIHLREAWNRGNTTAKQFIREGGTLVFNNIRTMNALLKDRNYWKERALLAESTLKSMTGCILETTKCPK